MLRNSTNSLSSSLLREQSFFQAKVIWWIDDAHIESSLDSGPAKPVMIGIETKSAEDCNFCVLTAVYLERLEDPVGSRRWSEKRKVEERIRRERKGKEEGTGRGNMHELRSLPCNRGDRTMVRKEKQGFHPLVVRRRRLPLRRPDA